MSGSLLDRLPSWVFSVMLLTASIIWGACFVVVKTATDVIEPSTIIGIRFAGATVLMGLFFFRTIRANWNLRHLLPGALLGLLYFLCYWFQVTGLTGTTPSKNAFIMSAAVVFVPFVYWLIARRRPTAVNLGMAGVCLVGLGLVVLNGDLSLQWGDAVSMGCAVFFAAHIACISVFARDRDVFTMTFIQFAVCGVLGLAIGLGTEAQPALSELTTPSMIFQLFFLIAIGAFIAPLLQNVGQTRVSASQSGVLLSTQSVFGTLFSILFYGEVLTAKVAVGFAIIFIAIVASELSGAQKEESGG